MTQNNLQRASDLGAAIVANVEKVIVGKTDVVKLGVAALFSKGHVLVEGVPGVGKTMLARALAKSVGLTFRRIQCTADLLPSDITGVYIFDQREREFSFRPGPVLSNIVLVDEINRASPKTQSALLECMEEHQITIDGITHAMPTPFLILATRNPTEHGGTFPLPETELDRFLIRLRLDYPSPEEEVSILDNQIPIHPIDNVEPVAAADEISMAQEAGPQRLCRQGDQGIRRRHRQLDQGPPSHISRRLPSGFAGDVEPVPVPGASGRTGLRVARRRENRGRIRPGAPYSPVGRRAFGRNRGRRHTEYLGVRSRGGSGSGPGVPLCSSPQTKQLAPDAFIRWVR